MSKFFLIFFFILGCNNQSLNLNLPTTFLEYPKQLFSKTLNLNNFIKHQEVFFDFYFEKSFKDDQIHEVITFFQKTLSEVETFTNKKLKTKIQIFVFKSLENKGLKTKNTTETHTDFTNKIIYTSSNRYTFLSENSSHKYLFLRLLLSETKYKALEEGLATYLTPNWQDKGFKYWTNKLLRANYPFFETDLFNNNNYLTHSNYVRKIYAAIWVDYLITKYGKDFFLKYYMGKQTLDIFTLNINKIFQKYSSDDLEPSISPPLPFLKGFNFAHEGYDIYNGYLGHLIKPSLHKLKQLNTNTIAIVPYTYMPDPKQPSLLRIPQHGGGENDQGIIYTNFIAKEMDFITMLKPQIWINGSWPGDIEMQDKDAWKVFFKYYRRWILHYAFLSQKYKIDILCIGVEMTQVALKYPVFWRTLIKDVRVIYKGKVTYAANWYQAFENIKFWNDLDYASINWYFPLSQSNNPSKTTLKNNFLANYKKVIKVAQSYNKPLLLTEIGFRSIQSPWIEPHGFQQNKPYNAEQQALCYQIVFEVLKEQDNYVGIYWWKWPSHLEYAKKTPHSFTPCGKPAEKLVSKYFNN